MKNYPLAFQIWLVFAGVTLGLSIILAMLLPTTLRSFFTREIYENIETAQYSLTMEKAQLLERFAKRNSLKQDQERFNIRAINHIVIDEAGQTLEKRNAPSQLILQAQKDANLQRKQVQRYSKQLQQETIFYVIRKEQIGTQNIYLVSYVWDSYLRDMVRTLFRRIMQIMAIALVASWLPALLLARYLTRPLVQMEKHVKRIADRDWHEPFMLDRGDEIGRLARSFERMRMRLVSQDEVQQSFLQQVSHDLKTPVMVIRSYAQSVHDGIYPQGNLPDTVKVIDEEAERLEKRIRGLLYLTKLDYLAGREQVRTGIALKQLVEEVIERLRWQRSEVAWQIDMEERTIVGDPEQWRVALENLLDNQLRYARERITVTLRQERDSVLLGIGNDGPPIPENVKDTLFQQFQKGDKGQFGLGLHIVQRIAALHSADVWAENKDDSVIFYLRIPSG